MSYLCKGLIFKPVVSRLHQFRAVSTGLKRLLDLTISFTPHYSSLHIFGATPKYATSLIPPPRRSFTRIQFYAITVFMSKKHTHITITIDVEIHLRDIELTNLKKRTYGSRTDGYSRVKSTKPFRPF